MIYAASAQDSEQSAKPVEVFFFFISLPQEKIQGKTLSCASFAAYSLVGLEDQQTLWGPAPRCGEAKLWITA